MITILILLVGFIICDKVLNKNEGKELSKCEECKCEKVMIPVGDYLYNDQDGGNYSLSINNGLEAKYSNKGKCGDDECTYADASGYIVMNNDRLVLINEKCNGEFNNCKPYYEFKIENEKIISLDDNSIVFTK